MGYNICMEKVRCGNEFDHGREVLSERAITVGCVSYINAKPLIYGIDKLGGVDVSYAVPSALLGMLEDGRVDVGLCPVIDLLRGEKSFEILTVGGIGSRGETMTVRFISKINPFEVDKVYADTDSHTSVMLLRILFKEVYGRDILVEGFDARAAFKNGDALPESMLLIGDKVVTDCPGENIYPVQIDLGQLWFEHTGLPFVFAVWMTGVGQDLGELPGELLELRSVNAERIDEIVERFAGEHDWPIALAKKYLGDCLRYQIGEDELKAISLYLEKAKGIDGKLKDRQVVLYGAGERV